MLVGSVSLAQEGDPITSSDLSASPDAMALAVDTSFTYQGSLLHGKIPVSAMCDFDFTLWTAATGGFGVGGTISHDDVEVVDGLFTVSLDFGAAAFKGDARWLQIRVDCGGVHSETLSPRQPLMAAPYALGLRPGATVAGATSDPALTLSNTSGHGLQVSSDDDDGVHVDSAGGDGVHVGYSDDYGINVDTATVGYYLTHSSASGLYINQADTDGVVVFNAGDPSITHPSSYHNGIEVRGAEGYGLYVGRADRSGVVVESAEDHGLYVVSAGDDGVHVGSAVYDGVYVHEAGDDGVYVYQAGDDGVVVNSAGDDGVYVGSAGNDGVYVYEAGDDGVYVYEAGDDGVVVDSAGSDGVYVKTAGEDGFVVEKAGTVSSPISSGYDNGLEVRGAQGNGVYVGWAGVNGVTVNSATDSGVYVGDVDGNGLQVADAGLNGVFVASAGQHGVYVLSAADYAGKFNGAVDVTGALTKGSGSFKIDHPLDPENQYLYHSFVESPDMMNIYNGNATLDARGEAWVQLPAWFGALNQDFRYQLTAIGAPGPNLYIAEEVKGNRFKIAGGESSMKVSWQVTGIRHDPYAEMNRILVEESKPADELGTYLHPDAYGLPEIRGLAYKEAQEMRGEQ